MMDGRIHNPRTLGSNLWGGIFFWAGFGGAVWGIVLHPDSEPEAGWQHKPRDSVVGRWATNASCVAVAPNYILTTKHQGGGIGTKVFFDGVEYRVEAIWPAPAAEFASPDLRLCRIAALNGEPAQLEFFTPVYTRFDEVGRRIVFGGYGDGRGDTLENENGAAYGYTWDASLGNAVLRWGSNQVSADAYTISSFDPLSVTFLLVSDFDGLGDPNSTRFEAALADGDSGGGWFIKTAEGWQVAGLGFTVETHNPLGSWFRDPDDPGAIDPNSADWMAWVRLSLYSGWTNSLLPCGAPITGDLDEDCMIDYEDLTLFSQQWGRSDCTLDNQNCQGADLFIDGKINELDLAIFALHWLEESPPPFP